MYPTNNQLWHSGNKTVYDDLLRLQFKSLSYHFCLCTYSTSKSCLWTSSRKAACQPPSKIIRLYIHFRHQKSKFSYVMTVEWKVMQNVSDCVWKYSESPQMLITHCRTQRPHCSVPLPATKENPKISVQNMLLLPNPACFISALHLCSSFLFSKNKWSHSSLSNTLFYTAFL